MTRLVVVLPLTPFREGDTFAARDWPLHVTLLPPFHTDATPAEVAATIRSAASAHAALTVIAGHRELFGRRRDVPVTVLVENESLTRLHETVVEAVRPLAVSPSAEAFTGTRFRPHITTRHHDPVKEGDQYALRQIALIDMAPGSAPGGRTVHATISLPDT